VSTRVAKTPVARFITSDGIMDVTLFKSQVAKTVNNFISYADEGAWDRTFFHRSIHNFVIQGGGFQVTSTNQIAEIPTHSPILLQAGLHNARGTIAMARTGDPNSATNQFFFNTVDNSGSLDPHPPSNPTSEGYAVFGTLANKASYATMDRLAARPVVDATTDPNIPPPIGGGGQFGLLVTLPILDQAAFDAQDTSHS
jgi:peptidyl-prolyl cis-trans isomerase A (cyclophilin A)